ncbi:MAG: efflux RND transporter periplasmic adaptor subunit [Bacteroidales bacterium]
MKRFLIYTVAATIALGAFSCNGNPEKENGAAEETGSASIIQPVKTKPITLQTIKRTVKLTANMMAEEEVYLAPGISGKIRSIEVDVNDRVKKGQTLVKMDRTQLAQTSVQYENLKKDLARMDTLLQYGSVTEQTYDQMKTQVRVTGVMFENLQENTTLRAPFDGVITGKYFNDGELFSPAPNTPAGKSAIVSLVKMDVLKLYVNLSETYLPLVKKGQIARVLTDVYPADTFSAIVYRINPTINPASRTFTVELRMQNKDYRLRPGMYSTVTLELGDRQALLVPALAVQKQPGTNDRYIFIYKDGVAKRISVTIGERLDDRLELLTNGVKAGDMLIYAGHVNLMDGDRVELVSE